MRLALGVLALVLALPAQAGRCAAQTGPITAALVELYTSEGCSGCLPAEQWLSALGAHGYTPDRVVPLALHVDYRDYIGWKDPQAKRNLSLRQRKLTLLQRLALVYTPQVVLQGRDFRGWGTTAFDEAVGNINASAPRARLALEIVAMQSDAMTVRTSAEILGGEDLRNAALYLAAYENRAESHVVLEWRGPIAFSQAREVAEHRLALLPKAVPSRSGVVGFVQSRRTAEVLQALMLPACPGTFGYIRAE